jgi:hypothetical protein
LTWLLFFLCGCLLLFPCVSFTCSFSAYGCQTGNACSALCVISVYLMYCMCALRCSSWIKVSDTT